MTEDVRWPAWFYVIIPYYAMQSLIGSFVKLYILDLGGSVLDLGLASSVFNLILIPAAMISGQISDYIPRRRSVLLVAGIGQLLSVLSIGTSRSISAIVVLYAVFSFFNSFTPTVFSLLMMETVQKERWGDGSARSFRFTIFGSITGLGLGTAVLTFLPLSSMGWLPVVFSAAVLALTLLVVKDSQITVERRSIIQVPAVLLNRLLSLPVAFPRAPKVNDFKAVVKSAGVVMTRDIPLIMVANALFFLGSNLFFTSYTPFLRVNQLTYLEMIALDFFITIINALASGQRFSGISKKGDPGTIIEFLSLRAIAFLFGAIASLYFAGHSVLYVSMMLYLLIGIAYTNITIGMNALIYRYLPAGNRGGVLGVYSALNSVAMFLGSFLSGGISLTWGYPVTFLLSSVALFGAASLFEWHFKPNRMSDEDPYE